MRIICCVHFISILKRERKKKKKGWMVNIYHASWFKIANDLFPLYSEMKPPGPFEQNMNNDDGFN